MRASGRHPAPRSAIARRRRACAFLYTSDWSHEFRGFELRVVPSHRLFGAAEFPGLGFDVATCSWGFVPTRLRSWKTWKAWQGLWSLWAQRRIDCLIATTEAAGLPSLFLRRLGLLRRPVLVIAVATLTPKYIDESMGRIRRWMLRGADRIVVLASFQVAEMSRQLGVDRTRVSFVPFGVDTEFFTPPTDDPPVEWDIAAVGTNEGKDFPTLVSALSPHERCLIVTDQRNAGQVRRTETQGAITLEHDIPILQLRALYLAARRIVVPLKHVDFSSGQTVLLETLALGRPVVVTDVLPVRDYVSTEVAMLVPPGDVTAMRAALDAPVSPRVPVATDHVRERFTIHRFAEDIAALCAQLIEKQ